ncbi:MAG: hypothetical protein ABFE16_16175 [Armatimonadia bacterium]
MARSLPYLLFMLVTLPACAQEPLVFEAETCSTPESAWVSNQSKPDKWTLWSTDVDAQRKWSGGVVLQSPPVLKDREKPEEGAPVLHTVLTNIPKGEWIVTIKYARGLAVSLDGKKWQRLDEIGGNLGRFAIRDGRFEFWVDDRFAQAQSPGAAYYDSITLTPAVPERNGVANGDFEYGSDFAHSGWSWSTREQTGSAEIVPEGHEGRGLKLQFDGQKDWTVINSATPGQAVEAGQTWRVSAWVRCKDTTHLDLLVVGTLNGRLVDYGLTSDGIEGTTDWKLLEATAVIPRECDHIAVRLQGFGKVQAWIDDVALTPGSAAPAGQPKTKVTGWATERIVEKLGRGMVAIPTDDKRVYLGWRLLNTDPADVAFNVYRAVGRGLPVKLNDQPLSRTTDFIDARPDLALDCRYWVRAIHGNQEQPASEQAFLQANPAPRPYLSIKLQGDYAANAVGIADLDGDGRLDFVLKQPAYSVDPGDGYWVPSKDSYKLEAYRSDGTFLWRKDLGWGIEQGIWYAPYLVFDFDGDGKAEVAAKTAVGDLRGADAHVFTGPEYLSILDGETGREKCRVDWPTRRDFGGGLSGYNYSCRNQLGLAFLDGKTPCLLVARGTYTVMKLVAYQYHDGKLQQLWEWSSREEGVAWRGQGAHWMHSGDLDDDGRDEVVLGSCVIDDDGHGLWSTGLGHPDFCFLGDLDPARPGLEISYVIEPRQPRNGACMVDARTGQILWGLDRQTYHVGQGMTADIDPTHPGCEVWATEMENGDPEKKGYGGAPPRWVFSAQGEILARDSAVPPFTAVYWDADSQRELCSGARVSKYRGQALTNAIEGSQIAWGDFLGDWREEIITSVPGELRIYATTIPATDRRTCLLQDRIYRADAAHLTMGYIKPPTPGRFLEQLSPALWISAPQSTIKHGETLAAKAILSASPREAVRGTVRLEAPAALSLTPTTLVLDVPAGQTGEATFEIALKDKPAPFAALPAHTVKAVLDGPVPLESPLSLKVEDVPLEDALLMQAEDFTAQGDGEVVLREDKAGSVGKAFSHWDAKGHWLTWQVTVPKAGRYLLVLRYCMPTSAQREIQVDTGTPFVSGFPGSGGFGGPTNKEWIHYVVRTPDQHWLVLDLTAGTHTIKLTNADGRGMNLDYLALSPVR